MIVLFCHCRFRHVRWLRNYSKHLLKWEFTRHFACQTQIYSPSLSTFDCIAFAFQSNTRFAIRFFCVFVWCAILHNNSLFFFVFRRFDNAHLFIFWYTAFVCCCVLLIFALFCFVCVESTFTFDCRTLPMLLAIVCECARIRNKQKLFAFHDVESKTDTSFAWSLTNKWLRRPHRQWRQQFHCVCNIQHWTEAMTNDCNWNISIHNFHFLLFSSSSFVVCELNELKLNWVESNFLQWLSVVDSTKHYSHANTHTDAIVH